MEPAETVTSRVGESRWPLVYIIGGLLILAALLSLAFLDLFPYRPWIAVPVFFALEGAVFLLLFFYAWLVLNKTGEWPVLQLNSSTALVREFIRAVLYVILISFAVGIVALLLEVVLEQTLEMPEKLKVIRNAPNSLALILFLIAGFTIAPVVEEIFFRAFLYNALKSRMNVSLAVVLQALVFSAVHMYPFYYSTLIFLVGVALALVYERRKNLLSPVLVHGLINSVALVPVLLISIQNYHVPAATWEEAARSPAWLQTISSTDVVEKRSDAHMQYTHAVSRYGAEGTRQWKLAANGLQAVWTYFPDDEVSGARARVELAAIYFSFLRDNRRAVVEADSVISKYPGQRREVARAWSVKGWAYYMLRDFEKSRASFLTVVDEYPDFEGPVEKAKEGLRWLDEIASDERQESHALR
jgi:membrane protease YdiL (CAAX protease family)